MGEDVNFVPNDNETNDKIETILDGDDEDVPQPV